MNIQVNLSEKSIKNAIKQLKALKSKLQTEMIPEFLRLCCEKIRDKANFYLEQDNIGKNVVDDIKNHWRIEISGNSAKLINDSEHAVYVEFGVGLMGQLIPHKKAKEVGYQYNLRQAKGKSEYWVYQVSSLEDVDMHEGYMYDVTKDGKFWIITKGSWRVMYAYHAITWAQNELQKPHGGEIGKIWQGVKVRYIV